MDLRLHWIQYVSISGTIYFFALGLLFIGRFVDLFLIRSMEREAGLRFREGKVNYDAAWRLLTFLGLLGIPRMYMGKWFTSIILIVPGNQTFDQWVKESIFGFQIRSGGASTLLGVLDSHA